MAEIDPSVIYLASGIILIFVYCALYWVMNRRNSTYDWFLGVLLIITAGLMMADPLLSSVKWAFGMTTISLPMMIALPLAIYETIGLVILDERETGNQMERKQ
jgi:hypothetical protein